MADAMAESSMVSGLVVSLPIYCKEKSNEEI